MAAIDEEKTLEGLQQFCNEFGRVWQQFAAAEAAFPKKFPEWDSMLNRHDTKKLTRCAKIPPLAIVGPKGSGKTTLMNALLGIRMLQPGTNLGVRRICCFSYAAETASRIEFFKLNKTFMGLTLKEDCTVSLEKLQKNDVAKIVQNHLNSTSAPQDTSSAEFNEWAQVIVHVHYPFPYLDFGFDLFDIPGASPFDSNAIKEAISNFWSIMHPLPVFVYSNPTFSDAEIRFLEEVLKCEDPENIFFVNAQMDFATLPTDENDMSEETEEISKEIVQKEVNKRFELLKEKTLLSGLPDKIEDCQNFSCVSVLDYQKRCASAKDLFDKVKAKLKKFIVNYVHSQLNQGSIILRNCINKFFRELKVLQQRSDAIFNCEVKEALGHLDELERQLNSCTLSVFKKFQTSIISHLTNPAFRNEFAREAQELELTAYDGASRNRNQNEATGAIKNILYPRLEAWVIRPELKIFVKLLQSECGDVLKAFRKNGLSQILMEVVMLYLDGSHYFENCAMSQMEEILLNSNSIFTLSLSDFGQQLIQSLNVNEQKIDSNFKKQAALHMLNKLVKTYQNSNLTAIVCEWPKKYLAPFRAEIKGRLKRWEAYYSSPAKFEEILFQICDQFRQAELSLLLFQSKLNAAEPTEYTRFQNTGIWNEHVVTLQTVPAQNLNLEEIHVSYNLLQLTLPGQEYLRQLLAIYKKETEYLLVYPYTSQSLFSWLQDHFTTLKYSQVIKIAKSLTLGLAALHNMQRFGPRLGIKNILVSVGKGDQLDHILFDSLGETMFDAEKIKEQRRLDIRELAKLFYILMPKLVFVTTRVDFECTDVSVNHPFKAFLLLCQDMTEILQTTDAVLTRLEYLSRSPYEILQESSRRLQERSRHSIKCSFCLKISGLFGHGGCSKHLFQCQKCTQVIQIVSPNCPLCPT